jgi:hypothetical protein
MEPHAEPIAALRRSRLRHFRYGSAGLRERDDWGCRIRPEGRAVLYDGAFVPGSDHVRATRAEECPVCGAFTRLTTLYAKTAGLLPRRFCAFGL